MNKKIYTFFLLFLFGYSTVSAAPNVKTETTYDDNTDNNKCPTSIIVQDNLKGDKDLDFSDLDCMFYKMDNKGNFLLDENGEKILRDENDEIDFSCLQSFLDKYTNDEFKEAANDQTAEGFPTNKYCPVYCVEENEFLFPGYSPVINSGGHFTWVIGENDDKNILDGLTVRLHGTKVCRTNVDLEQWVNDYKDIMENIEEMIDNTRPIKINNGTCTPNADNVSIDKGHCGFSQKPIKITPVYIRTEEKNAFLSKYASGNYFELSQGTYVSGGDNLTGFFTNLLPNSDSYSGVNMTLADGTSNRFAFSAAVNIGQDTTNNVQNSQITTLVSYNTSSEHFYSRDIAGITSYYEGSTGYDVLYIETWERNCCEWTNPTPNDWTSNARTSNVISSLKEFDSNDTFGFYLDEARNNYCGGPNGYPANRGCCGSWENYTYTECRRNPRGDCITGTEHEVHVERCTSSETPKNYYKYTRYELVCGVSGTGADQSAAASGPKTQCTTGNKPTCPSGYQYSSVLGTCQKADIKGIVNALRQLADLRTKLKQCHDQLIPYDYYLETDMEIEYNKTSDSKNNFYLPNDDNVTNTKLERVEENNPENDAENILGKYSSDVIRPSEKSNYSFSVNFFGEKYTFNKNSIPVPACTVSGSTKVCSAAQSSAYSDYWYDWYGRTYIAIYEYRLDGNFYRWVKMPSGESISTKPTGDYLKYNRYIDIGYANYPVHFATPASKYEGLNIKITNIGFKNYLYNTYETQIGNYNKNITDSSFVSTMQENELLHDCYYKVKEGEPYCPTTGCGDDEYDLGSVRIIYRPISLENPFPDMDASGRDTGSNWCKINDEKVDCSNLNDNVQKYILNNRNTSGSDIYFEREPMYEITLTPSLIKSIREYNATTDYDDYNLSCSGIDGEEGRKCRSNFVVDVADIDLPSLRDYITGCGIDSEWEACDNLDNYER